MTEYIVYGLESDLQIEGQSSTYSTARSTATGTWLADSLEVGQTLGGGTYICREAMFGFDTSSIPGGSVITAATLSLMGGDVTLDAQTFTLECRVHDWGETAGTEDYVAGDDIGSKTLVASRASADWTVNDTYVALTESGSALRDSIVLAGTTRYLLNTDRHRIGNAPADGVGETLRYWSGDRAGTTQDPKLNVTTADTVETFNSNNTWTVPGGVTSVTVECVAGGGGGGTSANQEPGGGGGAYARKVQDLTGISSLFIRVGAAGAAATAGGNSWVGSVDVEGSALVRALGGGGGSAATAGAGGVGASGTGTTLNSGGDGGAQQAGGGARAGSGGGGAGGLTAAGTVGAAGSGATIGAGGAGNAPGEKGGDGAADGGTAQSGTAPGGGGGGKASGASTAGSGAAGRVILTYSAVPASSPPPPILSYAQMTLLMR